jgi:intracellular septation protein
MKLLLDFFPIVLFFGAFKIWGIFVATTVAIVATLLQLAWMRYRTGRTEPMQWLSLGVIVLFGGATLIAQDETFIKWKPTVLYWAMGGALLVGQVFFRRNWLQSLMKNQMALPDHAWGVMLWSWCGFFALMGALNLWVAYHFDTDTWVNFKLFGGMGLMLVFVLAQAMYLGRYMDTEAKDAAPSEPKP